MSNFGILIFGKVPVFKGDDGSRLIEDGDGAWKSNCQIQT